MYDASSPKRRVNQLTSVHPHIMPATNASPAVAENHKLKQEIGGLQVKIAWLSRELSEAYLKLKEATGTGDPLSSTPQSRRQRTIPDLGEWQDMKSDSAEEDDEDENDATSSNPKRARASSSNSSSSSSSSSISSSISSSSSSSST